MTLLQKLKETYSDKFNQLIFLNRDSYVIKSCNTIFDTNELQAKSTKEWYPFIESIFEDVWNLDDQIRFAKVETTIPELNGTYDFSFSKVILDGEEALLWSIYDYTELYNDLRSYQQSRNELEIRRGIIEKKYKNLIDFNEVLVEKNKELENINQLHQDYFRIVQNSLLSPINTLDGVTAMFDTNNFDYGFNYIEGLKNSFQNLQSVFEDLEVLTTSFGGSNESLQSFNIYNLLVEVFDTFKKNTTSAKQLIFHIDNDTPEILIGKPVLLKQIIYCLMMNSYRLDHDAALDIHVQPLVDSNDNVAIQYIVKERKSEAMDSISKEKINELKLRLELVKKLIEIQGGSISIEIDVEENICIKSIMKYKRSSLTA